MKLFGDIGVAGLKYGPIARTCKLLPSILLDIQQQLAVFTTANILGTTPVGSQLNTVLVNYYQTGQDYMGFHSDIELALGSEPLIVSLSLGATRKFIFQNKMDPTSTHELELLDGSVLIMFGYHIQQNWKHSVPKMPKCTIPQWNLSFRFHLTEYQITQLKQYKFNSRDCTMIHELCKKFNY